MIVNTSVVPLVYSLTVARLIWKFDEYLKNQQLTPADVEREIIRLGYTFGSRTIYRFKGQGPDNLNRGSLEAILTALRSLTGKPVQITDLLEYQDD